MIIGTGIDMIELDRIEALAKRKPRFVDKILTEEERVLFQQKKTDQLKVEFLAGRFAAKEAFAKAYGTGIGKIGFHDMAILTGHHGEPRSEEHTSELQSRGHLVCRLQLEKN